jgi:hypothetical protein
MSGKGSSPRPYSVNQKTFDTNWDRIFKKDKREEEDAILEDEAFKEIENKNGSLTQLVECRPYKANVGGSNPSRSTNK